MEHTDVELIKLGVCAAIRELPAFLTLRAVRNLSRNYKTARKNSLLLNLNINFERCPHWYGVLESRRNGCSVI
jgi:hypothetical protein